MVYDVIMYNQAEDLELDEMWSFVQKKKNQRWLWLAVNHDNGDIIAYVFGKRQDEVFLKFQNILTPLGFRMYYTDRDKSIQKTIKNTKIEQKSTMFDWQKGKRK